MAVRELTWVPWVVALALGEMAGYGSGLGGRAASACTVLWAVLIFLRHTPAHLQRWQRIRQSRLRWVGEAALARWRRHHPGQRLLGYGSVWGTREAQRLHRWQAGSTPFAGMSPAVLAGRSRPLGIEARAGGGHMLVMGAPGTGKTQLFKLLALQAIDAGDAVVLLDPKGGRALRESLAASAARVGRPYYQLLPAEPTLSDRLDLLANGRDPAELASRLSRLIPAGENDNVFGQFAWMTLHRLVGALQALGEPVTLQCLNAHVADQGQALWHRFQAHPLPLDGAVQTGLSALVQHDPAHYRKMVLALTPILEMLAGGALGALLSSSSQDRATAPVRVNLAQIVRQGGVLYAGLGALTDVATSQALGALLLADLAAVAGDRYRDDAAGPLVRLLVDEAAEITNPAFIQMLNKGRECGVQVTFAVQTLADLEVAMGSEGAARMMLGNAGHWIAFRTLDAGSRLAWSERAGRVWARLAGSSQQAQQGQGPAGRHRGRSAGRSEQLREVSLVPEVLLSQLPDLHFMGLLEGRCVVGTIPLVRRGPDD